MIRYDRLWATMEACGMTQYRLIKQHNFSAGQIGRLKKNMHVSTHTLDTLCTILSCGIGDIIEFIPEGASTSEQMSAVNVHTDIVSDNNISSQETEAFHLSKEKSTSVTKQKKAESKGDKPKKAGKSKKGDKKTSKESKKGKDNKKNK